MTSSIYTSLTGLKAYSNGLNNISTNVTNMNSNGYKKNELLFTDLVYKYDASTTDGQKEQSYQGNGVSANTSYVNFNQGEITETGNDTDVAIDGRGFFVVKDDSGNVFYTRNGNFEFNDEGELVLATTGLKVQSLTEPNILEAINISGKYSDPATPTSDIKLSGNISTTATTYTLNDVYVYDSLGESHAFSIVFTKDINIPQTWNLTINDDDGNVVDNSGQIQFQGNGSPSVGFETYSFNYTPQNLPTQTITLDFGLSDTFSGVTSFSGTSELQIKETDGKAQGGLMSTKFDSFGRLNLEYSNGTKVTVDSLALADLKNYGNLRPVGNSLFELTDNSQIYYGGANTHGFGGVQGQSIELSNVDLTEEFTDMVIIQRGYQASSQVLTATNEMIQQLIEATRQR